MMTPEDRNNYVDYKQWANDRERKPKRAILELLISENWSIRLKTLTQDLQY